MIHDASHTNLDSIAHQRTGFPFMLEAEDYLQTIVNSHI
jgi:hypothetical protein